MASGSVENRRFVRARLVRDPTDIALPFPHGGTELGLIRTAVFRFGFDFVPVVAEELGGMTSEIIASGPGAVLTAVLREFDRDALSAVFPNVVIAPTQDRVIRGASLGTGNRPGYRMSNQSFKLLMSPLAVDDDQHLVLYNAIPHADVTAQLELSVGQELGIAVVFVAAPNANGRLFDVGKRFDIDLAG